MYSPQSTLLVKMGKITMGLTTLGLSGLGLGWCLLSLVSNPPKKEKRDARG